MTAISGQDRARIEEAATAWCERTRPDWESGWGGYLAGATAEVARTAAALAEIENVAVWMNVEIGLYAGGLGDRDAHVQHLDDGVKRVLAALAALREQQL